MAKYYFPLEKRAYFAQLKGYQIMPDDELLSSEWVTLNQDLRQMMGTPKQRACCMQCGEEIINGREIYENEMTLCLACAGHAYYNLENSGEKIDAFSHPFIDHSNPC